MVPVTLNNVAHFMELFPDTGSDSFMETTSDGLATLVKIETTRLMVFVKDETMGGELSDVSPSTIIRLTSVALK